MSSMTVEENVALPMQIFTDLSQREVVDLVNYKLGLVGLQGAGGFYPSELSGGMRKRAGLARAMALDPNHTLFRRTLSRFRSYYFKKARRFNQ